MGMNGWLEFWGLPLTVCNSQFRSGASDGTLLSEGMTWLCFLSSADVKTGEVGAIDLDLDRLRRPEPGSLAWGHMESWYRGTTACIPLL